MHSTPEIDRAREEAIEQAQSQAIETEAQQADAEVTARLLRQQQDADIKALLALPEGERFFGRIMEQTALFHTVFPGDDVIAIGYRDGCRSIGRWLLQEIKTVCPETAARLMLSVLPDPPELHE